MKLFSDTLPFYKANFHCHTTESDGHLSPWEAMLFYRDRGYQGLAITDHRKITLPEQVPEGLTLLRGIEVDYRDRYQCVHILGLGMSCNFARLWDPKGSPQDAVDQIRALGGAAVLAHPAWSLNSPEFILGLHDLTGIEIWNSVSTLPHNADRADSSSILDIAWTLGAETTGVFANDDAHFYDTEAGVAATMVQAESLSRAGLLSALHAGRFYATLGPQIHQIEVTDQEITVTCSPAAHVAFCSNQAWVRDRIFSGQGLTEARYRIHPDDRFVRAEVWDERGLKAWSAPIPVNVPTAR